MREPLDLERPREQLCPVCHDRGWFKGADRRQLLPCTNSSCSSGKAFRYATEVRDRLACVYSQRDAELWLQSQNPSLGGARPVNLIREGRGQEVLEVVERIPGIPSLEAIESVVESVAPALVVKPAENVEAVRRVLTAKLRTLGERRIADAFDSGNVSTLTDKERAVLDAAMTGTGFLVNGKRIDPDEVEVVRWPG